MPIDYSEQIKTAIGDIEFLSKLRKDVDPASCLSLSIRRGAPHDNTDVDDDDVHRPWRTMPFSGSPLGTTDGMHKLIDMVIADRSASLTYWIRAGAAEAAKVMQAADAAHQWLEKQPKVPPC